MRLLKITFAALGLAALPALAETPITADAFEAYVTGKTLDWINLSGVFGTEEYLPGRRVRWGPAFVSCKVGIW